MEKFKTVLLVVFAAALFLGCSSGNGDRAQAARNPAMEREFNIVSEMADKKGQRVCIYRMGEAAVPCLIVVYDADGNFKKVMNFRRD